MDGHIHDIQKLFESWKKRKLTIFGKCCIINSLAISKLIYVASVLPLPDENFLKLINKSIFNFIWNTKDRIKRNTLIGPIIKGGIGLVDIDTKIRSLKSSWIVKLLKTKGYTYGILNSYLLKNNINLEYVIKTNETKLENFLMIRKLPSFYKEIIIEFNKCKKIKDINKQNKNDILQQPIWNNTLVNNNGKTLFFKDWIKGGILYIKDLYNNNGTFKNLNDLKDTIKSKKKLVM